MGEITTTNSLNENRDTLVALARLFKELIEDDIRSGSPLYAKIKEEYNVSRS